MHGLESYSGTNPHLGSGIGIVYAVGDLDITLGNIHLGVDGNIPLSGCEIAIIPKEYGSLVGKIAYAKGGTNICILVPSCCLSLGILCLLAIATILVFCILSLVTICSALGFLDGICITAGGRLLIVNILIGVQDAAAVGIAIAVPAHELRQALRGRAIGCLYALNIFLSRFAAILSLILLVSIFILLISRLFLLFLRGCFEGIVAAHVQLAGLVGGINLYALALYSGIYIYLGISICGNNVQHCCSSSMVVRSYAGCNIQGCISLGLCLNSTIRLDSASFGQIYLCLGGICYHINNGIHVLGAIGGILGLQNLVGHSGAVGGISSNAHIPSGFYLACYRYFSFADALVVDAGGNQILTDNAALLVIIGLGILYIGLSRNLQIIGGRAGGRNIHLAAGGYLGIITNGYRSLCFAFIHQDVHLAKEIVYLIGNLLAGFCILDGIYNLIGDGLIPIGSQGSLFPSLGVCCLFLWRSIEYAAGKLGGRLGRNIHVAAYDLTINDDTGLGLGGSQVQEFYIIPGVLFLFLSLILGAILLTLSYSLGLISVAAVSVISILLVLILFGGLLESLVNIYFLGALGLDLNLAGIGINFGALCYINAPCSQQADGAILIPLKGIALRAIYIVCVCYISNVLELYGIADKAAFIHIDLACHKLDSCSSVDLALHGNGSGTVGRHISYQGLCQSVLFQEALKLTLASIKDTWSFFALLTILA